MKQHDYKADDLLANIRTHIPDFDMATEIMKRVRISDMLKDWNWGALEEAKAETGDASYPEITISFSEYEFYQELIKAMAAKMMEEIE